MANPNLSLPAQLEAVLYLKGRCLSLHQLSELVHSPPEEV
ncbi:MAG: SMC-Scp complex subunit ScpB, partial [Synechococcaceae bacterium WB4_2_0805]|nr:SMC-Scp complex subunit ScpB [Synechococcaceae bacterium WB4_2_0805]